MKHAIDISNYSNDPDYGDVYLKNDKDNNGIYTIPVGHGLKISCRDYVLKELEECDPIMSKFKLNIKRLNRWWFSVYFQDKSRVNKVEVGGKVYDVYY